LCNPKKSITFALANKKFSIHPIKTEKNMAKSINFKENNFVVRNEYVEMLRVEVNRYKPLEQEEVISLITEAQNGSEMARKRVINANLRLVWSIAASYGTMMEFADMFQNGSVGLCFAVDSYDVSRETKFSTWAAEYIRKQINIGLSNDSRVVRMGEHEIRAKKAYNAKSMDAPICNEDGEEKTLLDFFASNMSADNFSKVEDMRVKINYLMSALKPIEREVVCGLFGLSDTLETENSLSEKFNLTTERIRQIKWEALTKMKEIA
jgi:RNA polymerase primary sigma factor